MSNVKMAEGVKFPVECVSKKKFPGKVLSAPHLRVFFAKTQKIFNDEKKTKKKEECFFEEKTFSSFEKHSLQKRQGEIYAGGSSPSCIKFRQNVRKEKLLLLVSVIFPSFFYVLSLVL